MDNYQERYSRQLRLQGFGHEAQQKLLRAKVLIIGAGGLGVPVMQYLAGMGVGTIGIVDDDMVCLSNLHRQVIYTTDDIGQSKALVASARLSRLNPEIDIQGFNERLTTGNALDLISIYDVVVDATDNFATRYLINDACVICDKPLVYGAVQGYEGHVSVFNLADGPTYRCLYPSQPSAAEIPDCNTAGVLGVVPGAVGSAQALQVVKIITDIGSNLSGYLQVYDFLNDEQYKMKLKANPLNKAITALQASYEVDSCATEKNTLQPAMLKQWLDENREVLLVDVREQEEFEAGHIISARNVPLSHLSDSLLHFDETTPVILYCQKGSRSANALSIMQQQYPQADIYELTGGFDHWIREQGSK